MKAPVLVFLPILAIAGCVEGGTGGAREEVSPGLASCLTAIGRPDVAARPDADMSPAEIEGLVTCTSDRAGG